MAKDKDIKPVKVVEYVVSDDPILGKKIIKHYLDNSKNENKNL